MSHSLRPDGLWPSRLFLPWGFSGKNTGVGCLFLLQGIFPSQGLNPGLLHYRQIVYGLSHQGSPSVSKAYLYMCDENLLPSCLLPPAPTVAFLPSPCPSFEPRTLVFQPGFGGECGAGGGVWESSLGCGGGGLRRGEGGSACLLRGHSSHPRWWEGAVVCEDSGWRESEPQGGSAEMKRPSAIVLAAAPPPPCALASGLVCAGEAALERWPLPQTL